MMNLKVLSQRDSRNLFFKPLIESSISFLSISKALLDAILGKTGSDLIGLKSNRNGKL